MGKFGYNVNTLESIDMFTLSWEICKKNITKEIPGLKYL